MQKKKNLNKADELVKSIGGKFINHFKIKKKTGNAKSINNYCDLFVHFEKFRTKNRALKLLFN